MLDGWRKEDPPTVKKLPVEFDVPELLGDMSCKPGATELDRAVSDSIQMAWTYILRIGEYTFKYRRNSSKQTVQFRMKDVTFFKRNDVGQLRQLPRDAPANDILSADSATLKLDNQKNGWKGVCIHQESNGLEYNCGVRALGRRYVHIRSNTTNAKVELSAYFIDGKRNDVRDKHVSEALKFAAELLDYPSRGIPIERVDTHSLRIGGACALALNGYSDTQIQKMGRWRGATFKEYIREELSVYSEGMSRKMIRKFNFVNVAGGVYHDVTTSAVASTYKVNVSAAPAAKIGVRYCVSLD